ncbi:protein arginine N-methyltransferase 8-B-like [Lepeophtheirus salmonis]|uniref:protein arginine N-methyltransferase 8-B-like n=1 Tax=Lepeophtheirus salmonis TaxID=72036 RepID=UPI001AE6B1D9|nr:protein arginine N-methyltransferase 1-like [Lepeophtheirus salmonis]
MNPDPKESYQDSVYRKWINQETVMNLTVLDLSFHDRGFYSLLASSSGATAVYNIQKDLPTWINVNEVIQSNNSSIQCLYFSDLRSIKLPSKVNVIITNSTDSHIFYNFGLFCDVMEVKDRYLDKQKGFMIPRRFSIHLCAIQDSVYKEENINIWKNQQVLGFDLSPMMNKAVEEIYYRNIQYDNVISNSVKLLDIDLINGTFKDLEKACIFWNLSFFHESVFDALLIHFVIESSEDKYEISPRHPSSLGCPVFFLYSPYHVTPSDELKGKVEFHLNRNNRRDSIIQFKLDNMKEFTFKVI